jgi:dTDP-4-amino-4,6-dideoxygalactose transaminase
LQPIPLYPISPMPEKHSKHLHLVSARSGSVALIAAMRSLLGRRPGKAVRAAFSYAATALATVHAGLTSQFIDIDEKTLQSSATRAQTACQEPSIVALVPVHLTETQCRWDTVPVDARRAGLVVIDGVRQVDDQRARLYERCGRCPV